jgi:hypothetical protein
MLRKIALWCVCAILVLACFPMPSHAEENQCLNAITTQSSTQSPALPGSQPNGGKMTLEELKGLLGAKNVCGAECGFGRPLCAFSCGDAASCYHGFCVFI